MSRPTSVNPCVTSRPCPRWARPARWARRLGPIDEAVVLHVLRIRGFATPDGLTASLGEFPSDIVGGLVDAGLVRYIEPRQMYGLLPDGKVRHEALLEALADPSVRAELAEPYERFLVLNDSFKALCTTWQMCGDQPNDHSDAEYDRACIERARTALQRRATADH